MGASVKPPMILSDEEITIVLNGDRRDVDRLILTALNRLAVSFEGQLNVLDDHRSKEEEFLQDLARIGGVDSVFKRAAFVDNQMSEEAKKLAEKRNAMIDSLIDRNIKRAQMMEKVSTGTALWAVIAFLGFCAVIFKDGLIAAARSWLSSGAPHP